MVFKNKSGLPAGQQYKGNLHSHTTNSDGLLTPEQAVELFRNHGYSFLCLSEHDRYSDDSKRFNTDNFIILPGLEASANLLESKENPNRLKVHHMHGILGTREMVEKATRHFENGQLLPPPLYFGSWDGGAVAQQLADDLKEYGCLVTYNHPIWSRVDAAEFTNLEGVWALEIYNYNTVNESNTGADTTYWDVILRSGRQMFAFASDDNHNEGIFDDACGGWIMVTAPGLTHEDIIQAMLKGDFYSSSGPEIYTWGVEDDTVWIECSACERVNFICGGYINAGTTVISPTRDGLRRARFKLKGTETYVRVECVDYNGKFAWTNPIFLTRQ